MNKRKFSVGFFGIKHWCSLATKYINKYSNIFFAIDFSNKQSMNFHRLNIVHIMGSHWKNRFLLLRIKGTKFIKHWVGSDVLGAIQRQNTLRNIRSQLMYGILRMHHFANARWLIKELESINIKSKLLPTVYAIEEKNFINPPKEMPEKFTILTYLPTFRESFYGSEIIYKLAKKHKNILFYILASNHKFDKQYPNMKFIPSQDDILEYYDNSTVLLRLTEHDGLSGMVLEMLAHGRYVIGTYPIQHCIHVKRNFDDVENEILNLRNNQNKPNNIGREFVLKNYTSKQIVKQYISIYLNLIENKL
ncbi:MAG: glycosyltransferase [Candidatus Cloacimonetes bacterium]|nr:glycosyltransferase [Candidatus Cloacimonadota bacterium]